MRRILCEAVLFDLDGVLVDSTASIERIVREWAERHDLDPARVMEIAHGRRTQETIRLSAPHLDVEKETRELERMEVEDATGVEKVDGAADLLAGLPLDCWAIVTSGAHAVATARMRQTSLPDPQVIVSAEDVERGKPDPECYLKAARLLGVSPKDCLVVEDAPAGVQAARAAGMAVLAVATTHSTSELSDADAIAPTLSRIRPRRVGPAGNVESRLELLVEG